MDWNKKVYPKDIWNWLISLLPTFPKPKISLKKMRDELPDWPKPSSRDIVKTTINGVEREMTPSERRVFDRGMSRLDNAMEKLDRTLENMDTDFDDMFNAEDLWGKLETKMGIFDSRKEYPYTVKKPRKRFIR